MRPYWHALPLLVSALATAFVLGAPPTNEPRHNLIDQPHGETLVRKDMDMHAHKHNHHAEPVIELNETELLLYHAPTPPSYWSIDFQDKNPDVPRYPGLMGLHIVFMSLAFFGALPVGKCASSIGPHS
jgi:hypothetical protein